MIILILFLFLFCSNVLAGAIDLVLDTDKALLVTVAEPACDQTFTAGVDSIESIETAINTDLSKFSFCLAVGDFMPTRPVVSAERIDITRRATVGSPVYIRGLSTNHPSAETVGNRVYAYIWLDGAANIFVDKIAFDDHAQKATVKDWPFHIYDSTFSSITPKQYTDAAGAGCTRVPTNIVLNRLHVEHFDRGITAEDCSDNVVLQNSTIRDVALEGGDEGLGVVLARGYHLNFRMINNDVRNVNDSFQAVCQGALCYVETPGLFITNNTMYLDGATYTDCNGFLTVGGACTLNENATDSKGGGTPENPAVIYRNYAWGFKRSDGGNTTGGRSKGVYADQAAIEAAWPAGGAGFWADNTATGTSWRWNGSTWYDTGTVIKKTLGASNAHGDAYGLHIYAPNYIIKENFAGESNKGITSGAGTTYVGKYDTWALLQASAYGSTYKNGVEAGNRENAKSYATIGIQKRNVFWRIKKTGSATDFYWMPYPSTWQLTMLGDYANVGALPAGNPDGVTTAASGGVENFWFAMTTDTDTLWRKGTTGGWVDMTATVIAQATDAQAIRTYGKPGIDQDAGASHVLIEGNILADIGNYTPPLPTDIYNEYNVGYGFEFIDNYDIVIRNNIQTRTRGAWASTEQRSFFLQDHKLEYTCNYVVDSLVGTPFAGHNPLNIGFYLPVQGALPRTFPYAKNNIIHKSAANYLFNASSLPGPNFRFFGGTPTGLQDLVVQYDKFSAAPKYKTFKNVLPKQATKDGSGRINNGGTPATLLCNYGAYWTQ